MRKWSKVKKLTVIYAAFAHGKCGVDGVLHVHRCKYFRIYCAGGFWLITSFGR